MTERGSRSLVRESGGIRIGKSGMGWAGGNLLLDFAEMALPWPGQRALPKGFSGRIELTPAYCNSQSFPLDPDKRHLWWPIVPKARISVACSLLPNGGWEGEAYHDMNFGSRPLEKDFVAWDWARGHTQSGKTLVLYDAALRTGGRQTLGLAFSADAAVQTFDPPDRSPLPKGIWGVKGHVHCEDGYRPERTRRLEDAPFYTRSLVETALMGQRLAMVHETLDCRRLANPFVRMMLPFRMPRRSKP